MITIIILSQFPSVNIFKEYFRLWGHRTLTCACLAQSAQTPNAGLAQMVNVPWCLKV